MSVTKPSLTPSEANWLQAPDQQNIQRAAGTVIVQYQGQTYALVADYNFLFNDPHYTEDDNYGFGQQIGGKIGIIQNPFGDNGGTPVYLGATTPIPGVALNQLSLDGNGNLYASAFVDDTSGHYSSAEMMYDSLFVWNAAALIQEALVAQSAGQPLTIPIDRATPTQPQIPALTPVRYDGPSAQQMFGNIYGVGSYTAPGEIQKLGQQAVQIPPIVAKPPPAEAVTNASILGITDAQVKAQIAAGTFSPEQYAFNHVLYDGWNLFTLGFVGRQDARLQAVANGQINDATMYTVAAVDAATSIAGLILSGEAATGVAGVVGKGYLGASVIGGAAGGAAAGATLNLIQQSGEVATYAITNGTLGQKNISVTELTNSTVSGGLFGLGVASGLNLFGALASRVPRATYKIQWNTPTMADPLPFKMVAPIPEAAADSVSLADSTGGNVLADSGGTMTTPSGLTISLPAAQSVDTEAAQQWLIQMEARIPQMIDTSASLENQAVQAVQLENDLKMAARDSMVNQDAAMQLNVTDPTLTFQDTIAKIKAANPQLTGDALYKAIIADAATECKSFRTTGQPGGCFVAGTLVHTKEGLIPIEKLRVGDLVLTQPEMKGELSYRRVLQTFTFEDREVYRITYYRNDTEDDDKDPQVPEEAVKDIQHPFWENVFEHLVVTGNHPFWQPGVGWTAVDQLRSGDKLELSDGGTATVWEIETVFETEQPGVGWTRHGRMEDPGFLIDFRNDSVVVSTADVYRDTGPLLTSVFNIEVDGTHTYYVGKIGAWVHNTNCVSGEGDEAATAEEAAAQVVPSEGVPTYPLEPVPGAASATGPKLVFPKGNTTHGAYLLSDASGLPPPPVGKVYFWKTTSGSPDALAFEETLGTFKIAGTEIPGVNSPTKAYSRQPALRYANSEGPSANPPGKGLEFITFDGESPDGLTLYDTKFSFGDGIGNAKVWT